MRKALIIIDIQNDYFEGGANPLIGSLEASDNASKVLQSFRNSGELIVHIQHFNIRPGAYFMLPNTQGSLIHKNVQPLESENVINKNFPNSFRETYLQELLQQNNITDLVICGMMTHMCVDATIRAAKDFGYNITLISDACATRDLEIQNQKVKALDVHNSFLAALNYYYASVITTEQFLTSK